MAEHIDLGRVRGTDGASAYQMALEEGYSGSEKEFYAVLASLENAPYLSCGGGTMTGTLNMGGGKITMVSDPAEDTDAATKGYVDGLVGAIGTALDAVNGEVI